MSPNWEASLTSRCARQLLTYDQETRLEVGGMGLVTDAAFPDLDKPRVFCINKLWMMSAGEQADWGYCEIPAKERASLMFRLARQGRSDLLKVWHHKHPINTWSGTDVNTMRQRVEEFRPKGTKTWALSLVLTPQGFLARYDQAGDKTEDNVHVDLPVYIGRAKVDPAWLGHVTRMTQRYEKSQPIKKSSSPEVLNTTVDLKAVSKAAMAKYKKPATEPDMLDLWRERQKSWVSSYDHELRQYVQWAAEEAHGTGYKFHCDYYNSMQSTKDCPGCSQALNCYPADFSDEEDREIIYQVGYQQLGMSID
jgi:ribosomal protein L31